jgi:type I restriction enzyme S subunit
MVVPEKWSLQDIGSVAEIYSGGTPNTNEPSFWNGNIVWVTPSDITKQQTKYLITTERNISNAGLIGSSAVLLPKGTILLCTRATIGVMSIAGKELTTNQGFKNLVCNKNVDNEFLYYALQPLKDEMVGKAIGTTFLELSKGELSKIKLLVPNDKIEQTAIAEVLSDADSLIASLEKLIAKKKAIKQGAMQELLTGKKRLLGFSGEWVSTNLAAKSKLKARIGWQGLTTAEYLEQGYAYLITGTDFNSGKIDWNNCHYVDKKRFDQDNNIQITNEDILITKDGTIGKVAYVQNLDYPATLNSGVFVIRPVSDTSYISEFVYHIMNSFVFEGFLNKLSAGSTINHLYQKDFVGFNFMAPPTLIEQTAIATILSDMDAEIVQLEKKLAKYRLIKQGMMKELLTGRIRLVQPSAQSEAAEEAKTIPTRHNQHYDDAVAISAIVNAFYHEEYSLGRVKVQKLLYLLRRKQDADISTFKKKAAGPYNEEARYNGGESIAVEREYIERETSEKGSRFRKGPNIAEALKYAGNM